jgi:hypothetical protein
MDWTTNQGGGMKARQEEIFDKDGNLSRIVITLENGEHLYDALWDLRDEQNEKNRVEFRRWVKRQVSQKGHELT